MAVLRVTGFWGNPTRVVLSDGTSATITDKLAKQLAQFVKPEAQAAPEFADGARRTKLPVVATAGETAFYPTEPIKHPESRPPLVRRAFDGLTHAVEHSQATGSYPNIREQAVALLDYTATLEAIISRLEVYKVFHSVIDGKAAVTAQDMHHALNTRLTPFITGTGAGPDGADGWYYAMRQGETNPDYVEWFKYPRMAKKFAARLNNLEAR